VSVASKPPVRRIRGRRKLRTEAAHFHKQTPEEGLQRQPSTSRKTFRHGGDSQQTSKETVEIFIERDKEAASKPWSGVAIDAPPEYEQAIMLEEQGQLDLRATVMNQIRTERNTFFIWVPLTIVFAIASLSPSSLQSLTLGSFIFMCLVLGFSILVIAARLMNVEL
jgi:hypothetical protein